MRREILALAVITSFARNVHADSQTIRPDFSPNPLVLGAATSAAEVDLLKLGVRDPNCVGYVGQAPVHVLELPVALGRVKISAPTADILYARFGKQFGCSAPRVAGHPAELDFAAWPQGKVELFIGHGAKGRSVTSEIRIEDLGRPVQVSWKDDAAIPRVELSTAQKTPVVIGRTTKGEPALRLSDPRVAFADSCRRALFRQKPDLVLKLSEPLAAEFSVRGPQSPCWNLKGPIASDGRNLRSTLAGSGTLKQERWEAGVYGVWIGTPSSEAQPFHFVATVGNSAAAEPWRAPEVVKKHSSVAERDLLSNYPLLGWQALDEKDEVRRRVYESAPAELFVFPVRELNAETAELISGGLAKGVRAPDWPGDDHDRPPISYPAKNEPVLLISGHVLTADLLLFKVQALADLAPQASGALALPAAVRNPHASFGTVSAEGEELDPAAFKPYARISQETGQCRDRFFRPAALRAEQLRRDPSLPDREQRIAQLWADEATQEAKHCKKAAYEQARQVVWKMLIAAKQERRAGWFAKLRDHAKQVLSASSATE